MIRPGRTFLPCLLILPLLLSAQPASIFIVLSKDIEPFSTAAGEFRTGLRNAGIDAGYYEFNLEKVAGTDVIAAIRSGHCDLILAIGSTAFKEMAAGIDDIPIVFSMVLNPVAAGILPKNRPANSDIAGVTLDIPLNIQFQYLKKIVPDARTVGVLYDPRNTGSLIVEAAAEVQAQGLKLVSIDVTDEKNVPDAVDKITRSVNILWLVADPTVISPKSTEHILLQCMHAGIPVMGLSSSYVQAGSLFALSADYADIGQQSADIARQILQGRTPSSIAVAAPRKVKLTLNLTVAARLGIQIPDQIVKQAAEVFGP